jgi:hypothetical protein
VAPKEEFVKIETRLISGRGIIRIPDSDKYRCLLLYVNVVRLPAVNFSTSKWNPDKSEYVRITWERNKYIIRQDIQGFESQSYTQQSDVTGYIAKGLLCILPSIINYFDYIASGVGRPPLPQGGDLWIESLKFDPTVIKFCCRLDTAIEVQLWRLYYDINCEGATPDPPSPPDPPPPPKVPTGIPIGDISPPYPGDDDNGDTVPNPGDETAPTPEAPEGEPCSIILCRWSANFKSTDGESFFYEETARVYGESTRPYIASAVVGLNPIQQVYMSCRGLPVLNQGCGEYRQIALTNFLNSAGIEDLIIYSFEPEVLPP